jgi:hypothetical protein
MAGEACPAKRALLKAWDDGLRRCQSATLFLRPFACMTGSFSHHPRHEAKKKSPVEGSAGLFCRFGDGDG